jgi:hypothetical protein
MKETIIQCDICKRIIKSDKGGLILSGRVSGSVCDKIKYEDVCYDCTEKLFKMIKDMIII